MKSSNTSNFNVSSLIQIKVQKDKTKKMFFKSYLTLDSNYSNNNKILLEYLPAYLEKKNEPSSESETNIFLRFPLQGYKKSIQNKTFDVVRGF